MPSNGRDKGWEVYGKKEKLMEHAIMKFLNSQSLYVSLILSHCTDNMCGRVCHKQLFVSTMACKNYEEQLPNERRIGLKTEPFFQSPSYDCKHET
jgi:hypothetical protein